MLDRYGTKIEIGDTVMAADDWDGLLKEGKVVGIEKAKPRYICGERKILPACMVAFEIGGGFGHYIHWKYPEAVLKIGRAK